MTIAVNDAGDVLSDESGSWKPTMRAVNDKTGETLALDGGNWKPLGAAPKADAAPDTTPTTSEFGQSYAAPAPSGGAPGNAAVERIGKAATDAYRKTDAIQTPYAEDLINNTTGEFGKQLINPALHAAGAIPATLHAGMAALSQAAMEVFGEKGGRDALALLSSIPIPETQQYSAMKAGMKAPPATSAAETPSSPPQFISERFAPNVSELDPRNAMAKLIQHDIEENPPALPDRGMANQSIAAIGAAPDIDSAIAAAGKAAQTPAARPMSEWMQPLSKAATEAESVPEAPIGTAPLSPPAQAGAPIPESVGAAASRDGTMDTAFGRSAREIKGQQADMELADLMKTPQPGDARDIIPGATQTRAEIELSPTVSREAKGLRQEFREGFNDHEKANNELYHQWVDDVVPPREQVGTMKDVRETNWKNSEQTVFGPNPGGEPVSAATVVQHMQDVLSDPIEKHNSYLQAAFKPFMDKLTDDARAPIQLGAKELYGIRQEMGRKVKDMATDTDLAHLRNQFGDLMKVTDDAITTGAPDYRTMMDEYRQASIPINAAERLQDIKTKITNGSDRTITYGALDRYMKSLWMERNGPNPYAPAKDISPEVWDHLMTLHERLARSASADELARTKGSDTTQLMMEMMRKGAIGVAHAAAAKLTGGLGNIAIPYVTKQIDQSRALKKVGQHLNPDLSQYPPVVP